MLKIGRYDHAAYWSFFCYSGCSFVIPVVMIELARSLGFPLDSGGMGRGGLLHVARSISMLAAMLACGFVAGRFGKRRTLGAAVVTMGCGITLSALTNSYLPLMLLVMLAGVGEGMLEGIATPFVQHLHPAEAGRYVNIAHSFWSVGTFCCVLGIGALLEHGANWRLVVAATGALSIIPALLLWLPSRRPYPEEAKVARRTEVWRRSVEILRRPRFWLFFAGIFFGGGMEFCLTFWAASFVRLEFSAGAWAGGVGTAAIAAGMFVGRMVAGMLVRQKHLWHSLLCCALLGMPVLAAMPFLGSGSLAPLFALLFLGGISVGPFWPAWQVYCTDRMPECDPTLIFIYLSCAGIPGCGFFTWIMGVAGDRWGLGKAFLIEPGTLVLVMLILLAERWIPRRTAKSPSPSCP